MSVEFVDTNILVYAHDGGAGKKYERSAALLTRLMDADACCASIQVLAEFYAAATRKLGMTSEEAEEVLVDLGSWKLHCPAHADLLNAARLQRRYKISWWDALIVQSALALGCTILSSEDLARGQRYGSLTVQNPFA
jgi:predicted nucleic acid-binding protein